MAHVKAGGKTKQGTPRKGKRLGVKLFEGQPVTIGNIIVRQRGSSFHCGTGTKKGKDFTIFAVKEGKVNFRDIGDKKVVEVI